MNRTVKEHIALLEQRIRDLHDYIMENRLTQVERNRTDAEIRAAELALSYYRKALELEQQLV